MSNTIIIGDVAEGQKWFGVAEFLKQQLVATNKNGSQYMSAWKQVSADVKIFVKTVNGDAQAFIYTEGGPDIVAWPVSDIFPDGQGALPRVGLTFYENVDQEIKLKLTKDIADNIVGGNCYWRSGDKKTVITWEGPWGFQAADTSSSYSDDVRFTNKIYQNGKILATTGELVVLGCGVYLNNLVAVVNVSKTTDRVLTRPMQAPIDADWVVLGDIDYDTTGKDYFVRNGVFSFSQDGTKAISIVNYKVTTYMSDPSYQGRRQAITRISIGTDTTTHTVEYPEGLHYFSIDEPSNSSNGYTTNDSAATELLGSYVISAGYRDNIEILIEAKPKRFNQLYNTSQTYTGGGPGTLTRAGSGVGYETVMDPGEYFYDPAGIMPPVPAYHIVEHPFTIYYMWYDETLTNTYINNTDYLVELSIHIGGIELADSILESTTAFFQEQRVTHQAYVGFHDFYGIYTYVPYPEYQWRVESTLDNPFPAGGVIDDTITRTFTYNKDTRSINFTFVDIANDVYCYHVATYNKNSSNGLAIDIDDPQVTAKEKYFRIWFLEQHIIFDNRGILKVVNNTDIKYYEAYDGINAYSYLTPLKEYTIDYVYGSIDTQTLLIHPWVFNNSASYFRSGGYPFCKCVVDKNGNFVGQTTYHYSNAEGEFIIINEVIVPTGIDASTAFGIEGGNIGIAGGINIYPNIDPKRKIFLVK